MGEPIVVTALCRKRAELSGKIANLKRTLDRERSNLAHLDATLRMFAPDLDPKTISPKKIRRHNRHFGKFELSRRCAEILRTAAGKPLYAEQIARTIIADKALPTDDPKLLAIITELVLAGLWRLYKRGKISKAGTTRNAQWMLPPSML
jgi:hypothetical protein